MQIINKDNWKYCHGDKFSWNDSFLYRHKTDNIQGQ